LEPGIFGYLQQMCSRYSFILILLLMPVVSAARQAGFSRTGFYAAIESNDKGKVDAQESLIHSLPPPDREAFEGALMMKQASFISQHAKRLAVFKQGRGKLESAIATSPDRIEFYFLRLIIQEHAPRMLGYNNDITKDCTLINANFSKLPAETLTIFTRYRKSSACANTQP
jgi:hypothetical protein